MSIVIPTRNRCHLLPAAIRSALAQTLGDLEVVVSDNSSDDATRRVVQSFDDPRLRYVRTPAPLLMHESWRFALEQARGEVVAYLCDDDALHPRALAIASALLDRIGAEVVCWRSCSYLADSWPSAESDSAFRFGPPFTDRVFEIDGPALIELAYDMRVTFTDMAPKMLNAVVSRSLIERPLADGARLFRPSCPDYSATLVLAAYSRRSIMLDAPLLVVGATPDSIGASCGRRGQAARRFVDELKAREAELLLPPPPHTPVVWLGQTYMQCARDVAVLGGRSVNLARLYGKAALEIRRWEAEGHDVRELWGEFEDALAGPLAPFADGVRQFMGEAAATESDGYLKAVAASPRVLGFGPFYAPDGSSREFGFRTVDALAAGLDRWLEGHARRLGGVWDWLCQQAGSRRVVLYGLGRNGRSLLRMPPRPVHPLYGRIAVYDDGCPEAPIGFERLRSLDALCPRDQFVLVTPSEHRAIADKLDRRGFAPGRDWQALVDSAQLMPVV